MLHSHFPSIRLSSPPLLLQSQHNEQQLHPRHNRQPLTLITASEYTNFFFSSTPSAFQRHPPLSLKLPRKISLPTFPTLITATELPTTSKSIPYLTCTHHNRHRTIVKFHSSYNRHQQSTIQMLIRIKISAVNNNLQLFLPHNP